MNTALKSLLSGPLDAYKSIPFWSWNNTLDPDELVKQIHQMKQAGVGGFIMHARLGLTEEYLGEKWFRCIEVCLDEAKKLGMQAWIYDENGWPSGFVGGKLLENEAFRARFLELTEGDFAEDAFAVFAADEALGFRRVDAPVDGVSNYYNIFLRISPANTDILNPAVVDAFIAETHEQYYRRFADRFGKELVGFFTDEPQFYRWATPYTPMAQEIFRQADLDIRDGLIWLFKPDARGFDFRQRYYGALNHLYVTNFYKKLYDWCNAHGCKLTGHSIEEACLYGQMWGGGAVMPTYAQEDVPAIDSLGRNCVHEQSPKQAASVAAQLGKNLILTETFACTGYDATPHELKGIGESQYFHGVNLMCQHLYPYSIAGQGRIDHPQVFDHHSNWFEQFRTFNDYFTRLGAIIANTKENTDIAILHPMREVWLEYTRSGEYDSVSHIEGPFRELLTTLRRRGITYHFIDEQILADHGTAGDTLQVGQCRYDTLLIPKMRTISAKTVEILKNFTGKLCILGDLTHIDGVPAPVDLAGSITLDDILTCGHISFRCDDGSSFLTSRSGEIGDFLFIKNNSMTEPSHIHLENVAEHYVSIDLETLRESPISNDLTLKPNDSRVLLRSDAACPTVHTDTAADVTGSFAVTAITENYLVLDYGRISRNGAAFGPRKPIVELFEELLREDFDGELTVEQTFCAHAPMTLTLMMERAKLLSATFNGQSVTFTDSDFDVNFVEASVNAQPGENVLRYCIHFWQHKGVHFALFDPLATESLRNCLYYDTSLEPAYIKGRFLVKDDLSLIPESGLPRIGTPLKEQGYPFFKGQLTLEGTVDWDGKDAAILQVDGRYIVAELTVNSQRTDLVMDTCKDITHLLNPGKNDVTILLRSSLRNLFGPHHYRCNGDLMGVSPWNFSFRGEWNGTDPEKFTHDYMLVPFGADRIHLIRRQEGK